MKFILKTLATTGIILLASYYTPGIHVDKFLTAFLTALVIAVLNGILKPILVVITIPITFITFGLFLFVINSAMILLASELVPGFTVDNFWWALLLSFVLTVVNELIEWPSKKKQQERLKLKRGY